jgi:hypothetical protein
VSDDAAFLAADAEDRRAALAAAAGMASHRGDIHMRHGEDMHWLDLADEAYCWLRERNGQPVAAPADLAVISGQLQAINTKLEFIMSEDAAIQAVTADIQADVTAITANVATIQAALTAALADAVQPSTVSALQAAQAALDSLSSTVAGDATSDAPPAT